MHVFLSPGGSFVMYASHIYNHTPFKHHNWKMPFEMLEHTKPDVSHLWVLGCGAYVHIHSG